MSERIFKSRVILKHDLEENWLKAVNFIPKLGELIIYDKDENYNYARVKIGDGKTLVSDLAFIDSTLLEKIALQTERIETIEQNLPKAITNEEIDEICNGIYGEELSESDIAELMSQLK